ncbi:hypothetical protein EKL30_05320 [Candidimonas sp. SYP-B2681]|uniref:alcohol dehydrogenase catalytic domain-containing protein n=1 Tax=Candidimonas sp. SYP-B2681 TaxID=2497686 RepID=UPI000F87C007|nr:hypothetical protein [Candidimonas sp. SYP-B2681]RTZ45459.1 hypothetical protein EKL30_05320 [Candidimonas sp. SYP-B2681]
MKETTDDELMPGDVTADVEYSTVNHKDGLAITSRAPVIQTFPLIPENDLAGVVSSSGNPAFPPGERVVLNGWELTQSHHSGYSQGARVRGEWPVKLPSVLSARDAMAVGTAGYAAMLSGNVLALAIAYFMAGITKAALLNPTFCRSCVSCPIRPRSAE